MGSPITFGGFNNVDFGAVLNAIMQQERAPLAAIEAQRTSLQAQNTAFATFATRLGALESSVSALAKGTSLTSVAATSSDPAAVGISTGSSAVTGRYEVLVSQLARAQVTVSQTAFGSVDDVIATSGVLTLARFGEPPIDIAITGSMTLEDLASAINSTPDSPVNASVVQVSPGQYRLVLTGRATGAANAFTVNASALAGGLGLTFIDTDGDNESGDDAADSTQVARDALLTVNQVPITSSSNSLQDVIPGLTVNLLKQGPDAVSIDVTHDRNETLEQVKAFASAYNDVLTFFNEQSQSVANGKAGISRDPLVRGLREALRFTLMGEEEASTLSRLAVAGIGFKRDGTIEVNEEMLVEALDTSPTEVQLLFGGEDGRSGRFGAVKDLIADYTEAGGLVANIRQRIDSQVSNLNSRLVTMEEHLALRRAALQQEFIAADRAMSQLNSQLGSLSQLVGQYRLF